MTLEEALEEIEHYGIEMGAGDFVDLNALIVAADVLRKAINGNPVVPGHDDQYNIAEMSYNNGYAKGLEDGKPKWIPVAERLPEELPKAGSAWSEAIRPSADVLVKIKGLKQLYTAWYSYSHNVWADVREEHNFTGVTHWMPLPEPPQE